MDAKIINQFPIKDYLAKLEIFPMKDSGYYGMYHSPFREDHDASLKVDYNKNLWIDYGVGEGGTLIDLVMRMEKCSNGKAMQLLEQKISKTDSFSFHKEKEAEQTMPRRQTITIHKIGVLNNPSLLSYLRERCVNVNIARLHCTEIHYSANGKQYFAIGFKNDAGGYELRNKYFKGCISKDITTVKVDSSDTCLLFEGFMDYLSLLTLKSWAQPKSNVVVLNSLNNLQKVKQSLTAYKSVIALLDNDSAGKRAIQELQSVCTNINDQSGLYANHKDLNDYLHSKKQVQEVVEEVEEVLERKKSRGLRM